MSDGQADTLQVGYYRTNEPTAGQGAASGTEPMVGERPVAIRNGRYAAQAEWHVERYVGQGKEQCKVQKEKQ